MNDLPNELIQHMLSFLPQRYVAVASLVCKKWLIATRHKRFYQIIYIYSAKQLKKFLDIATTLKITKNNIPVGQLVCEINIDIVTNYNSYFRSIDLLGPLCNRCPNLTKIIGVKLELPVIPCFYKHWPYLTTIPFWYSRTNLSLSFHKQHDIITSLEYMVELYNTTIPYVGSFIKTGYEKNDGIIQVQIDQQQRLRSKKHHLNTSYVFQQANDQEFIPHYGKSIFFLTPSSWIQLKKLSLKFGSFTGSSPTWIYELDERVFNTINSTCPHLESLALYDFYMNLSADYLSALTTTTSATTISEAIFSHSSLKRLYFNSSAFHDSQCFDCISKLYPNITDLKIDLIWNGDGMEECKQYKLSLFNMITGFPFLKKLSADLKSIKNNNTFSLMEHIWPIIELYEWFINHPTQLEVLDYPFDLLDIEDFYLTHLQSKSQLLPSPFSSSLLNYQRDHEHNLNRSLAYLRHLTTLTLRLQTDPSDLLQYLHMSSCSTSVSLSITSLKIVGDAKHNWVSINEKNFRYNDNDFFIYQWLDAFPSVKKLDLTEVGSIKKEKIRRKRKRGDNDQQQLQQLQQQKSYVLEELYIQRVYFHMNDDQLREFFTSCPSLHTLSLSYINFVYLTTKPTLPSFSPPFKNKNNWNFIIFDMPHLHLDKLELLYIKIKSTGAKDYCINPHKSLVNEIAFKNTFEKGEPLTLLPGLCIIVNCKSVDILHI